MQPPCVEQMEFQKSTTRFLKIGDSKALQVDIHVSTVIELLNDSINYTHKQFNRNMFKDVIELLSPKIDEFVDECKKRFYRSTKSYQDVNYDVIEWRKKQQLKNLDGWNTVGNEELEIWFNYIVNSSQHSLVTNICSQSCCGYDLADVKLVAYVITPKDKSSQPQNSSI